MLQIIIKIIRKYYKTMEKNQTKHTKYLINEKSKTLLKIITTPTQIIQKNYQILTKNHYITKTLSNISKILQIIIKTMEKKS